MGFFLGCLVGLVCALVNLVSKFGSHSCRTGDQLSVAQSAFRDVTACKHVSVVVPGSSFHGLHAFSSEIRAKSHDKVPAEIREKAYGNLERSQGCFWCRKFVQDASPRVVQLIS